MWAFKYHSSIIAGRRHKTPRSKTKNFISQGSAISMSSMSALVPFAPRPMGVICNSPGRSYTHRRFVPHLRKPELREHKSFILSCKNSQQCLKLPVSPWSYQKNVLLYFLIFVSLTCEERYITFVLISVSLSLSLNTFICSRDIFWGIVYSCHFPIFLLGFCFFVPQVLKDLYILEIVTFVCVCCLYFLPVCQLSFDFVYGSFCHAIFLIYSQIYPFFTFLPLDFKG